MMVATFNDNHRATIISCYSPTNGSEETEQVAFYDELSSLVRSIPKDNVLVIGGNIVTLYWWPAKQTIPLSVLARNQTKGFWT